MPNRMIKDSIHTSETVNAMTDFQFRLWISLITYVDDYGRGDARAAVIRGSCFPLRERLTIKDIEAGLAGLAGIGCVVLYEVDGRPYLCFPTWERHQSIRNKRSRFPAPPVDSQAIEINCKQLRANVPVIQSNPNRIQTETESEYEPRKRADDASEFERFWDAYPKKQGKNAAETAFARAMKKITLDAMLAVLEKHKASDQWTRDAGKYIPLAATWLNGERWNDELQPAARDRKFSGFMHDGDSFSEMMKRDAQKLIREYGNGEADGT